MHFLRRLALASGAAALAFTLTASTAGAQAVFGAAEVDGDDTRLFLLGAAFSPGGLGWKPFGSVVGYRLSFDNGVGTTSRNVILPTVGLIRTTTTQSLSLGVGYAFSDDDTEIFVPVTAQSGDGVVASVGWDYWGAGNRMAQILGSFNFGNQYLWTRGRAATQLSQGGPIFVGGEAGIMGGGDENAFLVQFGPLLEYRFTSQFRLTGSAGLKVGVAEISGNTAYGRLEFLWLPGAR